jgi:hypothetical protein
MQHWDLRQSLTGHSDPMASFVVVRIRNQDNIFGVNDLNDPFAKDFESHSTGIGLLSLGF